MSKDPFAQYSPFSILGEYFWDYKCINKYFYITFGPVLICNKISKVRKVSLVGFVSFNILMVVNALQKLLLMDNCFCTTLIFNYKKYIIFNLCCCTNVWQTFLFSSPLRKGERSIKPSLNQFFVFPKIFSLYQIT
jgi:hypothetical protein